MPNIQNQRKQDDRRDSDTWDDTNRPSGPGGLPVLGNTLDFIKQPLEFMEDLSEYGDVVRCEFPKIDAVVLFHPDHVEDVLLTNQQSYRRWNFDEVLDVTGFEFAPEGLAFHDGEQWRRQRHFLQPMFGLDRLHQYADGMVEHVDRTIEAWDDGEEIALNQAFSKLSLAILTHSLFDLDMRECGGVVTEAAEALDEIGSFKSPELWLPSWLPMLGGNRAQRALDAFDETVDELIAERRANPANYDDLLARILTGENDQGYTMTDSEIHDQMLTFLLAGHETTATAMTFAWMLLACHPEKRERLQAEVEDVLGNDPPSPEHLADLTYTEQVIKETLRLYPPAPMLFRETLEDVTIGGYAVPEGTVIVLPQFTVHTDERWYDDSEAFRPERWTESKEDERPNYAYFPFGGGSHHCIGMRFAMMELKHVIPTIVQRVSFELLSDPDPDVQVGMTLGPAENIRMRAHKR
jgi:cytochrome P450